MFALRCELCVVPTSLMVDVHGPVRAQDAVCLTATASPRADMRPRPHPTPGPEPVSAEGVGPLVTVWDCGPR